MKHTRLFSIHIFILWIIATPYHYAARADNHHKTTVGVFCSANNNISQEYKTTAFHLGKRIGLHNYALVTGGSKTGLMKEVMDGYLSTAQDTSAYGILPSVLQSFDVDHPGIPADNLVWTDTIHQRLCHFHSLCDYAIIMPGGFGTLHELLDFLAHNQFGLITTTIIILNSNNFWSPLLRQLETMAQEHMVPQHHIDALHVGDSIDDCMAIIQSRTTSMVHNSREQHLWHNDFRD